MTVTGVVAATVAAREARGLGTRATGIMMATTEMIRRDTEQHHEQRLQLIITVAPS